MFKIGPRIYNIIITIISLYLGISLADETILYVDPIELVCPQRLDLMAKYIYAKQRTLKVKSSWGLEIYKKHLQYWNCFFEYKPAKNCFNDFLSSFNNVLDDVEANGFRSELGYVPINSAKVIANGAHRTTACLLYQIPVPCVNLNRDPNFNYKCFQAHHLPERYIEAMVLQYIELKPNISILLSLVSPDFIPQRDIVYQKEICLTPKGIKNLSYQLPNYNFKQLSISQGKAYLTIYHSSNKTQDVNFIQITAQPDLFIIARFFLHRYTFELFSHYKIRIHPDMKTMLQNYSQLIAIQKEPNLYCLSEETTLAILNKGNLSKLNYYKHRSQNTLMGKFQLLSIPDEDEIIYHPDNFFYFLGIKIEKFKALANLLRITEKSTKY